jgi:putative ABC transport system permease protein
MLFKLILKNIFRARLRSALTLLGLVVAVVAFGLLRTVVDAWYAGSDAASGNRLITRNAISLTFTLPTYYRERVKGVDGVSLISMSNWFGGIYQEPKNFFPQFAVTLPVHFELYPEYVLPPEQMQAMLRDRTGTIVGRAIADQYGWKIGDKIPIQGTIYPGTWEFTVRGIYEGRDEGTLTRQLYFHWDYLNERLKVSFPRAADRTGVLVVGIKPSHRCRIQKFARRDTHRDRKGISAWICCAIGSDHCSHSYRELRSDLHHLSGRRQHHGHGRA